MSRKSQSAEQVKTLGRSPRSLTAPLAAFTMALVLGSYCISSIRTARRDARYHPYAEKGRDEARPPGSEPAWLTRAVEESKGGEGRK